MAENPDPGRYLRTMILVENLPPKVKKNEIFECFSRYGNVMMVKICSDHFRNNNFFFRRAYVRFDTTNPIKSIIGHDLDISVGSYFVEVSLVHNNPFVYQTACILGIGNDIDRDCFNSFIQQYVSCSVIDFSPSKSHDDGFAIIQFKDIEISKSFIASANSLTLNGCMMKVKAFPQPTSRFFVSELSLNNFQTLRKYPKYRDFVFKANKKEYSCSSIVASLSCSTVRQLLTQKPPVKSITINAIGNFQVIIDILYGVSVQIDTENCEYIYECASEIGHAKLIREAGKMCYELLTCESVFTKISKMVSRNIDPSYAIEFIAMHLPELQNRLITLPTVVLNQLIQHPAINDHDNYLSIFDELITHGKISISNIRHRKNSLLPLSKAKCFVINDLELAIQSQRKREDTVNDLPVEIDHVLLESFEDVELVRDEELDQNDE